MNIVEATKLSERLDDTLRRYHNRAVDSVQVIEKLIALAKDISTANARSTELELNTPRTWRFTMPWQRAKAPSRFGSIARNGVVRVDLERFTD